MANTKTYTVKVDNDFTGIGAGGTAFANGVAVNVSPRMAEWFKQHRGYTVTEDAKK